ncbi:MAG: MBL fold metallo-hydrolase [Acidobacteria bacterium]|nr:MAG: MBL fold metallo-hydrolase [Acidobacteriota bacterium]REK08560.1 MAG: MBL fold metallo-hydrolase [Acidobacteriota bacterium]
MIDRSGPEAPRVLFSALCCRAMVLALSLLFVAALAALPASAQNPQQRMLQQQFEAQAAASRALVDPGALRVFVCGSASPLGAQPEACVAVIAGGRIFLVDIGGGTGANLALGGIPLEHLRGVFLTHFHSDHISGLGDVNLASWVAGRSDALTVYGGGGVERVVAGFNEAYALDRRYRTEHHGAEMLPPATGPMQAKAVEPGVVLEHDGVKVTAFEVDHDPIAPALGYRFDYRGRSVVVSGDTVKTDGLIAAAKGADLLLHDAMALPVVQLLAAARAETGPPRLAKLLQDIQTYHAPVADVVAAAEAAQVRKLVLYHLVPAAVNPMVQAAFRQGLPEGAEIAADGQLYELPADSEAIEMRLLFER